MMRSDFARERQRRQGGAALLVAVMLLALMGAIGLASLETVTADRQVSGFHTRAALALEAADAGVSTALGLLRDDLETIRGGGVGGLANYDPGLATTTLGQSASFPYGRPSFAADATAAQPIDYLGRAQVCDWMLSLEEGVLWHKTLWDIRVQGQTSDGTTARVQAVAGICRPYNVNY